MTPAAAQDTERPRRVWFVDVMRLLASLQMVNGHTVDAVILPALKFGPIFDYYNWGRGLVSVGFLMVSGIAFSVSTLARFERHRADPQAIRRRFRRAAVVVAAGYFLGLPWGASSPDPAQASLAWTYFFSVGILHCIGVALLVLEALTLAARSAGQVVWAAGVLAALAFAVAPLADATLEPRQAQLLLNWISHQGGSPFPLLPWAGNVFAGVVVGSLALPLGGQTPHRLVWSRLGVLAGGTWLLAAVLRAVPWTAVTAATHPSARPAFVVANLSAVLGATLGLSVLVAPIRTLPRVLRILAAETLAIYVFHLVVLFGFDLRLARRIGPILSLPQALAVSAFMITLTGTFAVAWHGIKAVWQRPDTGAGPPAFGKSRVIPWPGPAPP
ncbi:MAG: heparan-alpha-glucosaminide N-acetyltransferase domain-containing protein [Vicinamibacterales bacterium]